MSENKNNQGVEQTEYSFTQDSNSDVQKTRDVRQKAEQLANLSDEAELSEQIKKIQDLAINSSRPGMIKLKTEMYPNWSTDDFERLLQELSER